MSPILQIINIPRLTDQKIISFPSREKKKKKSTTDLSPPKSPMVVDRAIDAPRDATEPPKVGHDGKRNDGKYDRFCALGEAPSREDKVIEHVRCHDDAKIERRELFAVSGKTEGGGEDIDKMSKKKGEVGRRDVHSGERRLRAP